MSPRLGWPDVESALAHRPAKPLSVPCAKHAAVALVLREVTGELELLLVRRAEHPDDPWSDHMAFPGGRAEPGDRDLVATAVRETLEEMGLDLTAAGVHLGALDEIQAMRRSGPLDLSIAPFVFRLRAPVALALGDEVVSAHWMSLATLMAPGTRGTLDVSIDGVTRVLPCLRIDGQVIWGLTFRMFEELAERLRATRVAGAGEGEDA